MDNCSTDTDEAVWALARAYPQFSAHVVVTRRQAAVFAIIVFVLGFAAWLAPYIAIQIAAFLLGVGFVANVVFRSVLIWIGAGEGEETRNEELHRLCEEELPVYSVLVPVYREAKVIQALVRSLKQLDYPGIR